MRILRISGGLDPAFGGPSNSTMRGAVADARAGHAVTLAFARIPGPHRASAPTHAWLVSEGVELRGFGTLPGLRRFGHRFGISPRLVLWLIREIERADIVHLHGAWSFASFTGLFIARIHGVPTILTPHESLTDADVGTSRTPAHEAIKRALRRLWLGATTRVVFSSHLELWESCDGQARSGTTVIPHPVVDERKPAQLVSRPTGPREGRLRLGFLGRFHEKKNLPLLLEAVAALPEEVSLTVSGGGYGSEGRLRGLAHALGISQRVTWMGFITGEQRDVFWSSVDVLVLPSRFECFGMVVAEAMERGVPAIVADRVGAAGLVHRHDAGIVIRSSAREIEKAALGYLHNHERLVACSARARRGALSELTLQRYGDAMTGVYRSLEKG